MDKVNLSVLIPTHNEEKNIKYALDTVKWADEVFIIDSFSTDRTLEIVKEYPNVKVFQHKFENYSAQKNWALDNLPWSNARLFILDADERITPELKEEILEIIANPKTKENGFYVNRRVIFLGRWLRHCGWYPSWNLRLFRRGRARYEDRAVGEHMLVDGKTGYLKNDIIHENHKGLFDWIEKHNRYSSFEAKELYQLLYSKKETGLKSSFFGKHLERKRAFRERIWPRLPLPLLPLLRFFQMYFLQLGFLDGYQGFVFCSLEAIYEFQIAIKLRELKDVRHSRRCN